MKEMKINSNIIIVIKSLVFTISIFVRSFFAGVCEEVFFRGALLNYLCKYKGRTFSLLVSSMIFMVFHCTRYTSANQLLCVFLAGFTLGYLYIITKSLYMSIGLHFATDFFINLVAIKGEVSFLILDINAKFNEEYLTQTIFTLTAGIYTILLIILIVRHNKYFRMLKGSEM